VTGGDTLHAVPQGVADAARHLAEGDAEAAVMALSAAGTENPDNIALHFMTALVAWSLDDTAKALALGQSCFDRDPGNGTVAEVLASLHAQAGDLMESLYYGKLATALGPDATMSAWLPQSFPSFGKAFLSIQEKPLLAQARLLLSTGRLSDALDKARQHVEVAPGDDEGRHFFAEQLLRADLASIALETAQPLAERRPLAAPIASTLARALAAVGEGTSARFWHDHACTTAPENAAVAAARIADAPWLGVERQIVGDWTADWVKRFVTPGKARRWRPAGDRLVIGYLVSHFADRRDPAAVAAVARSHDRAGVTVIGYGLGAQSWEENAVLRGAFDKWRNVAEFDPATLAKTIAVDGADVIIDVGGLASPTNIRALARVNTAVRVAWLCDPRGLEHTVYDAVLGTRAAETGVAFWQPVGGAYPLLRDWTQPRGHASDAIVRFGSDAALCQIDAKTALLWREILVAVPEAALLLRARDMTLRATIDRLVERFGADVAGRIDIVNAASPDEFYRQVDVALAPVVAVSPHQVGEAIACGVPLLALDGGDCRQASAGALRDLGLGEFVHARPADFVAAAVALVTSVDAAAGAAAAASAVADRGENVATEIAAAIEQAAKSMLAKAAA
jgi:hypothetical protein